MKSLIHTLIALKRHTPSHLYRRLLFSNTTTIRQNWNTCCQDSLILLITHPAVSPFVKLSLVSKPYSKIVKKKKKNNLAITVFITSGSTTSKFDNTKNECTQHWTLFVKMRNNFSIHHFSQVIIKRIKLNYVILLYLEQAVFYKFCYFNFGTTEIPSLQHLSKEIYGKYHIQSSWSASWFCFPYPRVFLQEKATENNDTSFTCR